MFDYSAGNFNFMGHHIRKSFVMGNDYQGLAVFFIKAYDYVMQFFRVSGI
jgi:hypothetical protein